MDFIYCQNPADDVPIILIDKHIGDDPDAGPGIRAEQYVREVLWLDQMGKSKIETWINSVGGSVMEGMAIFNVNILCKTPVDTVVVGVAASISAVIAQSGRRRKVMANALEMFHNPFNPEDPENKEASESLVKFRLSIINMICERTGLSEKEVSDIMAATTWMDSSDMINSKMCDEVISTGDKNTDKPTKAQNAYAAWKVAAKYVNKLVNDKKIIKMSKVANRLNLNPDSTEDSMVSEIDKIENASKHYQKKTSDLQATIEEKEKELKELKDKMKALEDKIAAKDAAEEEAKAKAEAEATDALNKEAEKYVTAAITAGKIQASAKDVTIKNFVANPEGTKAIIDAIPVNGKAVKIETGAVNTSGANPATPGAGLPTSANLLMAEIMNKNPKKY